MDNEPQVWIVLLSKKGNFGSPTHPVLRWIVEGVDNQTAAIRACMRMNARVTPRDYDTVEVRELINKGDNSVVRVFDLNRLGG